MLQDFPLRLNVQTSENETVISEYGNTVAVVVVNT